MLANKILTYESSVRFLKGVGPERARLLEELGILTIRDLLIFYPRRYENRFPVKKISELCGGDGKECVAGRLLSVKFSRTRGGKNFVRAFLAEGGVKLFVTWFNAPYLAGTLKKGARIVLWGKAENSGKSLVMVHPEFELSDAGTSFHFGGLIPIYPLVEDLSQKGVRSLVRAVVQDFAPKIKDRLTEKNRARLQLMPLSRALQAIHFPKNENDLIGARGRLVFDEFFILQLAVGLRRLAHQDFRPDLSQSDAYRKVQEWTKTHGFAWTAGQTQALNEILSDLRRPQPMHRLLQADVGSGKTVVAAGAILHTVLSGFQAAFMAPTEVLARQQMFALTRDLEPMGVRLGYLGAGDTARNTVLQRLAAGDLDGVVGTHALLSEGVRFKNLGLAVVDEQHKFGVAQRAALRDAAGKPAHYLMLTATPIPRSLAMTLYGDLDVSEIREKPKGRQAIHTARAERKDRPSIYRFVESKILQGGRAFVVCPTLTRSMTGVSSTAQVAEELRGLYPQIRIGCLHGRLKPAEKERLVREFREGRIQLLVCTAVIEVGIDVPDAGVIVLENAERFGMAQLHQLRGRVGRGGAEGYCFLVSDSQEPDALERLDAFCRISSGFEIAEKDLEHRGSGSWIDRRQHGWMELGLGDFARDERILKAARSEAQRVLTEDPRLESAEHKAWRVLVERRFQMVMTGEATA